MSLSITKLPETIEQAELVENLAQMLTISLPPLAENINAPKSKREYTYHYCPECEELNAFPVYTGKKSVIYECDWCNSEFKI